MSKTATRRSAHVIAASFGAGAGVVVGHLRAVDSQGVPTVDFPGNEQGAVVARWVGPFDAAQIQPGAAVALAFDRGDRGAPLILGVVSERLPQDHAHATAQAALAAPTRQLLVDGDTVHVRAEHALSLTCGRASILLREDGKIVIKGGEIVSRASGAHKIKGGLVNIN